MKLPHGCLQAPPESQLESPRRQFRSVYPVLAGVTGGLELSLPEVVSLVAGHAKETAVRKLPEGRQGLPCSVVA